MKKYLLSLLIIVFLLSTVFAQDNPTDNWSNSYYAPYVYMARYPVYQLSQVAEESGLRYFTLAFITAAKDCQAKWLGATPIDSSYIYNFLIPDLEALRAMGGDVIISFGGAAGNDLAQVCSDVESLVAQYQAIIDIYGVTHLDFDIEGDDSSHPDWIERRSQAIVQLQANNDNKLVISYTLSVEPTGLTDKGMAIIQSAIENDVSLDLINIMTMNYGKDFADKAMGDNTIQAAESLFTQLQSLYPDKSESEIWGMMGLTPMAGMNDRAGEIFTVADAEQLLNFALKKEIRLLSLWSLDRDQPCEYVNTVTKDCSGTEQKPLDFSMIFNQVNH